MAMNRTLARSILVIFPLVFAGTAGAEAVVYQCVTSTGTSFQDYPCDGAKPTQNRVLVTDTSGPTATVRAPTRDRSLSEWVARTERDNQRRETENRVKALEEANRQEQAEFAVMMEDIEEKKEAAVTGSADVPPAWMLDLQARDLRQQYAERIQGNNAEIRAARQSLAEER
jgi:hypothetical protein